MMVIDTHIFLWYVLDDPKLEKTLRNQIRDNAEEVVLSSISIWEAILLAERGRIQVQGNPAKAITGYAGLCGFRQAAVTTEIVALSRSLPFEHDDPADRFIAATAHSMALPLATADSRLRDLLWLRLAN